MVSSSSSRRCLWELFKAKERDLPVEVAISTPAAATNAGAAHDSSTAAGAFSSFSEESLASIEAALCGIDVSQAQSSDANAQRAIAAAVMRSECGFSRLNATLSETLRHWIRNQLHSRFLSVMQSSDSISEAQLAEGVRLALLGYLHVGDADTACTYLDRHLNLFEVSWQMGKMEIGVQRRTAAAATTSASSLTLDDITAFRLATSRANLAAGRRERALELAEQAVTEAKPEFEMGGLTENTWGDCLAARGAARHALGRLGEARVDIECVCTVRVAALAAVVRDGRPPDAQRAAAVAAAESFYTLGKLLLDLGEAQAAGEILERAQKLAAGAAALPRRAALPFEITMARAEQLRRAGNPQAALALLDTLREAHDSTSRADARMGLAPTLETTWALIALGRASEIQAGFTRLQPLKIPVPDRPDESRDVAAPEPPRPETEVLDFHLAKAAALTAVGRLREAEEHLRALLSGMEAAAAELLQSPPREEYTTHTDRRVFFMSVGTVMRRRKHVDAWELDTIRAAALHDLAGVLEARCAAVGGGEAGSSSTTGAAAGAPEKVEQNRPRQAPKLLLEEAGRLYAEALRIREEKLSVHHWRTKETQERLVKCRERLCAL